MKGAHIIHSHSRIRGYTILFEKLFAVFVKVKFQQVSSRSFVLWDSSKTSLILKNKEVVKRTFVGQVVKWDYLYHCKCVPEDESDSPNNKRTVKLVRWRWIEHSPSKEMALDYSLKFNRHTRIRIHDGAINKEIKKMLHRILMQVAKHAWTKFHAACFGRSNRLTK